MAGAGRPRTLPGEQDPPPPPRCWRPRQRAGRQRECRGDVVSRFVVRPALDQSDVPLVVAPDLGRGQARREQRRRHVVYAHRSVKRQRPQRPDVFSSFGPSGHTRDYARPASHDVLNLRQSEPIAHGHRRVPSERQGEDLGRRRDPLPNRQLESAGDHQVRVRPAWNPVAPFLFADRRAARRARSARPQRPRTTPDRPPGPDRRPDTPGAPAPAGRGPASSRQP